MPRVAISTNHTSATVSSAPLFAELDVRGGSSIAPIPLRFDYSYLLGALGKLAANPSFMFQRNIPIFAVYFG